MTSLERWITCWLSPSTLFQDQMQKLYCRGWIYRGYVVLKGSASWLGTRRLRPSARCHTQHNTGRGTLGILIRRAHHCTGDTLTMWHCNNDNGHGGLGWAPVNNFEGEDKNIRRDTHCFVHVHFIHCRSLFRSTWHGKKPSGVIILSNKCFARYKIHNRLHWFKFICQEMTYCGSDPRM